MLVKVELRKMKIKFRSGKMFDTMRHDVAKESYRQDMKAKESGALIRGSILLKLK